MSFTQDDLEALYGRLEKPLYNVVYRRIWEPDAAHDVVQETFLRLWSMRARVVPDTVEALAYRIGLNLVRSRLRRKRIRRFLTLDAVAPAELPAAGDAEQDLAAAQDRAELRRAVDALPADVRDVLLLSEFGSLRYAEISSVLGIPEGTVGSRRNRALRLLRRRLSRSDHE